MTRAVLDQSCEQSSAARLHLLLVPVSVSMRSGHAYIFARTLWTTEVSTREDSQHALAHQRSPCASLSLATSAQHILQKALYV